MTPRGALPGRKPGIFVRCARWRTASPIAESRRSGGTSTRTLRLLRGAGVTVTSIESSIGWGTHQAGLRPGSVPSTSARHRRGIEIDRHSQEPLATLATGFTFPESPRWHDRRLWVSDWGAGQVLAIDLGGRVDVVARVESFPMCIDHLPDGRLLVVASSRRQILRQEADGSLVTHAGLGGLADHPWNDIVVDGRSNAYVNNIGFDFASGDVKPGIIALVTPDGAAREVADALEFPNGMAVTADNRTLIVAESYGNRLTAFDIGADGDISNRRLWANVGGPPDGICLDAENAIWYADVPNARCVRVRE